MRRRLLAIALLWSCAAGFALWIASRPRAVHLSDGTTLRLLGISIGTNSFTTERPWHKYARRVLPTRYQHLIPLPVSGDCGFKDAVTYWFEILDKTGRVTIPNWRHAEIVTDDGEILHADTGPNCGMPYSVNLECLPRRERSFRYRIYNWDDEMLGEIRLSNPFRGPFPEWKPDPLPVTRTNGELSATLKSLRKVIEVVQPGKTNITFRPDIEFSWNGQLTADWETGPCFVYDATGNYMREFQPNLPRSEKVWRWRVWMQHRMDAPVPPEARYEIANLPVPRAGSWTVLNVNTNVQGVNFWIGAWAGPSAMTFSNNHFFNVALPPTTNDWQKLGWGRHSGAFFTTNVIQQPTLIASIRGFGIPLGPRIVFRDQNGRVLPMQYHGGQFSMGIVKTAADYFDVQFYRPELDKSVESVSIEVTVHPRREMSFFIAPPAQGEWIGRPMKQPAR